MILLIVGAFPTKKIPARNGPVFPMQRSWGLRVQSSGVAAKLSGQ
jgi:hypothetical protein